MILLIITCFVNAFCYYFNHRCHYRHIRHCGFFTAFTFSEELGFGEGGHVFELSPPKLYLKTSGRLVTPHTPFMVDWHLGNLLLIVINTNLGLFAVLVDLLWFFVQSTCFA